MQQQTQIIVGLLYCEDFGQVHTNNGVNRIASSGTGPRPDLPTAERW